MIPKKLYGLYPNSLRVSALLAALSLLCAAWFVCARNLNAQQIVWTRQQKTIVSKIRHLRQMPDKKRGRVTKQLALEIREMPPSINQVRLAEGLASLSTEGDPGGRETVQAVATTLAGALGQHPLPLIHGQPAMSYFTLASLVYFEHMRVSLRSPLFTRALAEIRQQDMRRRQANFTLADLTGRDWTLKSLRGKVVVVNFWATWCPPCRKEIPDLKALYKRFKSQGLVVLGISDEPAARVRRFSGGLNITYPILLDPGRKVSNLYSVESIPMTFVYNRNGKLVAEAMDMRTRKQFLAMLAEAGLK